MLWPDGQIRWLEACGTPASSDPSLWLGVTMDITNRKTAELALIRSEKLLVTSRLASSVSHEINNPLEAMTNLIFLAGLRARDEEARAYLKEAEKELARIAYITKQALRFHRQQALPVPIDVAATMREVANFYEPRMSAANISLSLEAQPVPELLCCASEITHVFGNLIQKWHGGDAGGWAHETADTSMHRLAQRGPPRESHYRQHRKRNVRADKTAHLRTLFHH